MKSSFRIGEWRVEPRADRIVGPDKTTKIEPRVMQVLVYLADHAGEVVTRDEILQAVWEGTFVSDEVLTIAISKLRKAFGDDGNESAFIQTVPKKGYRLNASVSPVEELQEPPAPVPVVHGSRWGVLALVGALATLLVVAVGLNLGGLRDRLTGRTPGAPIESIAVLPLQTSRTV
jgi:DNA-binding winged helix-turn-helix (wHTH) protein